MTEKRFKRYLLDGGFWFDDYVEPVWGITDTVEDSPITYLEFQDKYKDLCDEVVNFLNELSENLIGCNKTADNAIETIKALDEENKKLKENYVELETSFDICVSEKRALEMNILAIKEVMCKDIGYGDMQKQIEVILND